MSPDERKPSRDPSVEHEPHFGRAPFRADPSELKAAHNVEKSARDSTADDLVEHSVWDEPARSSSLSGAPPEGARTYAGWLESRRASTGWLRSWSTTLVVAVSAGPLAIVGTFCGTVALGAWSWIGIVSVTIIGPILEEMLKLAAALWVVEKRPFLFRSRVQIAVCCLAAGLVFAAIENVLYMTWYLADPPAGLIRWRWTVCVAMHMTCSLVAGFGLMRIWSTAMTTGTRPQLTLGSPFLIAAAVIHGAYNTFAVVLELIDFRF